MRVNEEGAMEISIAELIQRVAVQWIAAFDGAPEQSQHLINWPRLNELADDEGIVEAQLVRDLYNRVSSRYEGFGDISYSEQDLLDNLLDAHPDLELSYPALVLGSIKTWAA